MFLKHQKHSTEEELVESFIEKLIIPNRDLIISTVEIYLNNELINKDIKHNLLANLIICFNMQMVTSESVYNHYKQESPDKYIAKIMECKVLYFEIVTFIIIHEVVICLINDKN